MGEIVDGQTNEIDGDLAEVDTEGSGEAGGSGKYQSKI